VEPEVRELDSELVEPDPELRDVEPEVRELEPYPVDVRELVLPAALRPELPDVR
jgi:hypothetical protein